MLMLNQILAGLLIGLYFLGATASNCYGAQSYELKKQYDCSTSSSSPLTKASQFDVWVEFEAQLQKRRCYCNPLRRLRKRLRLLRRRERQLLKQETGKPSHNGGSLTLPKNVDIPEAAQNVENISTDKKMGRPATIQTDHVFCPTKDCCGFEVIGPHPDHWIVGFGTYTTKGGEKRQMYLCKWCEETFSETLGTVFWGLKTPSETIYRALACLAEGMGIRATARIFGVKKDTILLWLRRAGKHSAMVSAYLIRNLQVEQAQLDELWTFVYKKEKALSAWERLHTEYGDTWIWTAIDPIHKLVIAFHVGDHEQEQAEGILKKVKAVLAAGCLPLFTSDELPHYVQAILKIFGHMVQPERNGSIGRLPKPRMEPTEDLQYATVHKKREGGRIISVTTQVIFGSVKKILARLKAYGMKINTSFVERMNLTLRHLVSRLRRKGLTFSKKRKYLEWHLHLSIAYYHFVLPHRGLRLRLDEPIPTKGNGSPKKWEYRTPAMSAGLTDHIWSMRELLTFRVPMAILPP